VSWHKNHYGIGNFFIVLTGAVEEKHIENIKDFLENLPKANQNLNNIGTLSKPKLNRFIKTADEIGEVKEQVEITILRIGQSLPYTRNQVGNAFRLILNDILFERLRIEHSLCYSVQVALWLQKSYSQIFMTVKTEEKNINLVEDEFWNILREIENGKHKERFATLKKVSIEQIKSQELLSGDIANSTLNEISKYNGHIITLNEQLAEVEKVTYEDIVKFASWAFDPQFTHTEIILPSKK
jgi:predicted Zn-dependent peptidase